MATLPPRELKIGTIIDKTLGVVEVAAMPALIYAVVLTIVTGALAYFTVEMIAPTQQLMLGLVKFVIGVIAAYVLLEIMVRKTGVRSREGEAVFFAYLGLAAVSTLGVIVGFILVVLPGLFLMARWSIAAPMLIARGDGAMKSLGESWELTRGNEFSIIVAALAILVPLIGITIACSVLFERTDPLGIAISQGTASVMSVLQLAMSVALYGLIVHARIAVPPAG